jgi:uncharacterized membrane protein YdjX (TVP38/TMEM64 family)
VHKYKKLVAVFVFMAVLFAVFELSGLRDHFNVEFLQFAIHQHQIGGLLIFMLLFSLGNLIHIPGWVFLAAAVLTLGRTMGGMVTYVAASFACMTTFLAVRYIGGDALRQLDNRIAIGLLRQLDAHPIRSITLLRVLFQTVPALNYTLAISGVRFRQYLVGTLLGLPLPIMLYCLFFDYLAKELHIL